MPRSCAAQRSAAQRAQQQPASCNPPWTGDRTSRPAVEGEGHRGSEAREHRGGRAGTSAPREGLRRGPPPARPPALGALAHLLGVGQRVGAPLVCDGDVTLLNVDVGSACGWVGGGGGRGAGGRGGCDAARTRTDLTANPPTPTDPPHHTHTHGPQARAPRPTGALAHPLPSPLPSHTHRTRPSSPA